MLTVQSNMAAMSALNALNTNSNNQNVTMQRLSTGFRINSASDDAAGFAISSKLIAQKTALSAASSNALQATSMVKMADSAQNEIQNMLVRLKTLATQASSANNSTALSKLDAERVALETQITKMAQSANYNGVKLLDGTSGIQTFQVGASSNSYDQITANFSKDLTATGLGLGAAAATFPAVAGAAGAVATSDFGSQTNAQAYIAKIDAAINTVSSNRAEMGATVNSLSYVTSNLATTIEQTSAAISTIKDADMANQMAQLTKQKILSQVGISMLAQANQSQQSILSLFR